MELILDISNSQTTLIVLFGFWVKGCKKSVYDCRTSVSNFQWRLINLIELSSEIDL